MQRQMTVEQVTNRVSLFSNYRLSVCIILAGAVAFVLSNLRNMVAGLKPVFFPIYANISSIEGASEGKSLGWCCTWSLHRVVVMLAPLAHLLMVNHKTIVALLFTLAFVCLNTVCNFTCRHFHKLLRLGLSCGLHIRRYTHSGVKSRYSIVSCH